ARVLDAIRTVERHRFLPADYMSFAYDDRALPIGSGQTISQPYVVASMTEALSLEPDMKVLEVGTGSGYQAAVLAEMGATILTMEILPELARSARKLLAEMGYDRIRVIEGDGYMGLPGEAPFDRVIITAAPPAIPDAPLAQLAEGGIMVVPVGTDHQDLLVIEKTPKGIVKKSLFPVRFVPMVQKPD
ncbi:MAG: protein-L-isoaspartate(D-aspartate) O-methyltransferase, partial [Deltaproteobacteria bacterium]|nr:protein-L-isoaspartate(D-aspartate) O-methyltransferase [Deltaproteobacteria bacterium]